MGDPTAFESAAASVSEQVAMVMNAPIPFLLVIAAVAIGIWQLVKREFATRLANAESTIALQDRQLEDYKSKLDGATPDEARARIDALERRIEEQLSALAPRRLTDEQRQAMVGVLDSAPGHHARVVYDAAIADTRSFAQSLMTAFDSARWVTSMSMIFGPGKPPKCGLALIVPDPTALTPPQQTIFEAFRAAGLEIELQRGGMGRSPPDETPPIADILITSPSD